MCFTILFLPQFLFTCIGWVASNRLWTLARGGAVEKDPNFEDLSDFILSDQIAGSNVALGIGYVCSHLFIIVSSYIFLLLGCLWWFGLDCSLSAGGAI
jgi:hypothetical protein